MFNYKGTEKFDIGAGFAECLSPVLPCVPY